MSERLAAISVDLDEVPCYTAIHGITAPDRQGEGAIYGRALPRLVDLFEREAIPATFFVIGRDLESEGNRSRVADLARRGFELANHSYHHHYDLTRRPAEEIREEIVRCAEAIENASGVAPLGFRAPGYTVTDTIFDVLEELGALYDSSVFPCPPYQFAKALAIMWIALRRRKSHSISDDARVLTAPAQPYSTGRPYWRHGTGLLEMPIGVTSWWSGRLPYIGTTLCLAGERRARWLTRRMGGQRFVNLELHGIDAADAQEDGLEFLAPHQPDLRKDASYKLRSLSAAIATLREEGYRFVTLEQAAKAISSQ